MRPRERRSSTPAMDGNSARRRQSGDSLLSWASSATFLGSSKLCCCGGSEKPGVVVGGAPLSRLDGTPSLLSLQVNPKKDGREGRTR